MGAKTEPGVEYKPQRKLGPREIRKEGRFKLASERAGIKPMTARDAALAAQDMSWATGRKPRQSANYNPSAFNRTRRAVSPDTARSDAKKWFKRIGNNVKKFKISEQKLVEVFKMCDADNSGYIELDEFMAAFNAMDLELDQRQITQLFREVDTDRSGAIDYKEFKGAYNKIDAMELYVQRQMKQAGLSGQTKITRSSLQGFSATNSKRRPTPGRRGVKT